MNGNMYVKGNVMVAGVIKVQSYYFRFYGISNQGITNGASIIYTADTTTPYYAAGYTQNNCFKAPVARYYQLNAVINMYSTPVEVAFYGGFVVYNTGGTSSGPTGLYGNPT